MQEKYQRGGRIHEEGENVQDGWSWKHAAASLDNSNVDEQENDREDRSLGKCSLADVKKVAGSFKFSFFKSMKEKSARWRGQTGVGNEEKVE